MWRIQVLEAAIDVWSISGGGGFEVGLDSCQRRKLDGATSRWVRRLFCEYTVERRWRTWALRKSKVAMLGAGEVSQWLPSRAKSGAVQVDRNSGFSRSST